MKKLINVCIGLFVFVVSASASSILESLTENERANARVSVDPLSESSPDLKNACLLVGQLWDNQKYASALDIYRQVADQYGEEQFCTSINWKTPVPTNSSKWSTDVKIGNRDSIYELHYDIHRASGNLIAVAHFIYGTGNMYTVNLSTNGGLSWSETGVQNFAGSNNHGVSGTFIGDYFFYTYGNGNRSVVRKFRAATGIVDTFSSGLNFKYVYTLSTTDTVLEVAMCSNQDVDGSWLLHTSITKNGQLLYYFSDTTGYTWTEMPTGVANAAGGLDMCYNEGFTARHSFVSYYNDDDTVKIGAININTGGWQNVTKYYSGGFVQRSTSISAYRDTVLCAFNAHASPADYCEYLLSYTGGNSWTTGAVGGESDTTVDLADITLRKGGGIGAAYRFFGDASEHLRYGWRSYSGSWSAPERMSDSAAFPCKPSIEYLGSGVYGIVFASWAPVWGALYFDRSDWATGVSGEAATTLKPDRISIYPSPVRDRAIINWQLSLPGRADISVYDVTGRLVLKDRKEHLSAGQQVHLMDLHNCSSGVYLIRIEGAGPVHIGKMVVIK